MWQETNWPSIDGEREEQHPANVHSAGNNASASAEAVGKKNPSGRVGGFLKADVTVVLSGSVRSSLSGVEAPLFQLGGELVYTGEWTEVDPVNTSSPHSPVPPPYCPKGFIIVGDEIKRPPIIVEAATGGRYRKRMFTAEASLVEILLFCERAKSRGETRIKVVILADAE